MNSLSWLLYAADAFPRISGSVGAIAFLSGIGVAIAGVVVGIIKVVSVADEAEVPAGVLPAAWSVLRSATAVFLLALTVWFVVPSRDTVMLIAASEVGETVLASERVQEIGGEAGALATDSLRVLRKFINEQLGGAE